MKIKHVVLIVCLATGNLLCLSRATANDKMASQLITGGDYAISITSMSVTAPSESTGKGTVRLVLNYNIPKGTRFMISIWLDPRGLEGGGPLLARTEIKASQATQGVAELSFPFAPVGPVFYLEVWRGFDTSSPSGVVCNVKMFDLRPKEIGKQ